MDINDLMLIVLKKYKLFFIGDIDVNIGNSVFIVEWYFRINRLSLFLSNINPHKQNYFKITCAAEQENSFSLIYYAKKSRLVTKKKKKSSV